MIDFEMVKERMDADENGAFSMLYPVCEVAGLSLDDIDELLSAVDAIAKHTGVDKKYIAAIINSQCFSMKGRVAAEIQRRAYSTAQEMAKLGAEESSQSRF
jgi:hypothetical protein